MSLTNYNPSNYYYGLSRELVRRYGPDAARYVGNRAKRAAEDWWNKPPAKRQKRSKKGNLRGSKTRRGPIGPARANATGVGTTVATTGRGASRVRRRKRRSRKKQSLRKRVGKLERKVPKLSSRRVIVERSSATLGSPQTFATPLMTDDATPVPQSIVLLPQTTVTTNGAWSPGCMFGFDGYFDVTEMCTANRLGELLYFDHPSSLETSATNNNTNFKTNWVSFKKDPCAEWIVKDQFPSGTLTKQEVYADFNLFRWSVMRMFTFYNNQDIPIYLQFNELRPKDPTSENPIETALSQLEGNAARDYALDEDEGSSAQRNLTNSEYANFEYNPFTLSDVKKRFRVKTRTICIQPGGHYVYSMKNPEKWFNWRNVRKEHTEADGATHDWLPSLGSTLLNIRQAGPIGAATGVVSAGPPVVLETGVRRAATQPLNFTMKEYYTVKYQNGGIASHTEQAYIDRRNAATTDTGVTIDSSIVEEVKG